MPEIENSPEPCEEKEALEVCLLVTRTYVPSLLVRVSSYNRLKRITALMNRLVQNCRAHRINETPQTGTLTTSELSTAEEPWIITVQGSVFPDEVATLQKGGKLSCNSKLLPSAPISESNGVLHVGGRQSFSTQPYAMFHPIVLPGKHT